jgi:hypothetical protein
MILLKPGDKVVCIDEYALSHRDGCNEYEGKLYKNRIYTIDGMIKKSIKFGYIDIHVCQYDTSDKECVRIDLVEINHNKSKWHYCLERFITLSEFHKYRKEKLINLNKYAKR